MLAAVFCRRGPQTGTIVGAKSKGHWDVIVADDLIGAIYDAPLEDRAWATLAGKVRRLLGSHSAMFKFARYGVPDNQSTFVFDAGWDVHESWPLYDRVYRHLDPTCHRQMIAGTVYSFDEMVAPQTIEETEFYSRFCRSLGADHALFVYLGRHRAIDAWFSLSRDSLHGPFGEPEIDAIRGLLPHMERATELYARLESQRSETAIYAATVGALGVGVVMLDDRCRIIATNNLADEILELGQVANRSGDLLRVHGELIRPAPHGNGKRLMLVGDGDPIVIGRDPAKGGVLLSQWRDEVSLAPDFGPAFVVYLDDPSNVTRSYQVKLIAKRFGLTLVEARLTALLVAGRTLDQAAIELGITTASVRTYCKRVLAKTGVARQTDLVRLVLNSIARLA